MNEISLFTRLRFKQIRLTAKVLDKLCSQRKIAKVLGLLGRSALIDRTLVGFRRTFPSFEAAHRYARKYKVPSHEHGGNVSIHISRTDAVRPSDYPLLFHLQRLFADANSDVRSVLDIGGSIGNLFYCYSRYLHYPAGFKWTVCEVPQTAVTGRKIAEERGEDRLIFVDRLDACTEADIIVISGALHYFESLPPEMTSHLHRAPRHVFINRTPVIDGPSAITLQDHEQYIAMSPARILSRQTLLECMAAANYELVDQWNAPELRLNIPLHPEASVSSYSGFYFRARKAQEAAGKPRRRNRRSTLKRIKLQQTTPITPEKLA